MNIIHSSRVSSREFGLTGERYITFRVGVSNLTECRYDIAEFYLDKTGFDHKVAFCGVAEAMMLKQDNNDITELRSSRFRLFVERLLQEDAFRIEVYDMKADPSGQVALSAEGAYNHASAAKQERAANETLLLLL